MKKIEKMHHSVTENGNFQGRIITRYEEDDGTLISEKYGNPMEPSDPDDMAGWDARSQDIVGATREPNVMAAFGLEKAASHQHPEHKPQSGIFQSKSYDRVIEEDGRIAIRRIDRVFDDGVEISKKYHRTRVIPGDDLSSADILSKAIAEKIHTQEVVQAYQDKLGA